MERGPVERRTNLPVELSSFVGRRHELAQVRSALSSHRLVTLFGPGGVGKTRLGFRAAAELVAAYPDGAWVVELARVGDPGLVADTVVSTLGLNDISGSSAEEVLTTHLRDRELLLVLDNCEHLQDAVVALVTRLLAGCPTLSVLATSRHSLAVDGERLVTVPPLPVPSPGHRARSPEGLLHYDSVRLFVDRAAASSAGFEVTERNQRAVADLVRRLDGLPLAIELASVRVRSLSVQQILDRLADRFALLTRGDRAALPRQQTLQALLDWSYDLLSAQEQRLWERAAVFAGSFDLRDADAVLCDDELRSERLGELVEGLTAKSVLVATTVGGVPRLRMLESLKEYGLTRVGEAGQLAQLQTRHLDHYRAEVHTASRELFGPRGVTWFRRLGAEHDDLREALERCAAGPGPAEQGCMLIGELQHYWVMSGRFSEGRHWVDRMLDQAPPAGPGRAAALVVGGRLAVLQGDAAVGRPLLERGLAEATAVHSSTWRAHALHGLAITALFWQEPAEAQTLLEEALDLHRLGEDPFGVPLALIQLATVHATLGDTARAMEYAEECIELSRQASEHWCRAMARWTQALVVWQEGRYAKVRSCAREVLRLKEPFGDRLGMAMSIELLAWVASRQGGHEEAARLLGGAQSALRSIGGGLFRHLQPEHDQCVQATRAALGEPQYDRCLAEGAAVAFEDVVALALGRRNTVGAGSASIGGAAVRLTRREAEIAQLVAQGLTDREIAERLVLAQRTAEGHVQRTLGKLGFTSRRQLASWVADQAG